MNTERLSVGVQGLGLAEAAYQGSVAYARERIQGRALAAPAHPELAADPIIVHPDVRRMLLTQRAYIEGSRALALWVARAVDDEERAADPAERAAAGEFVALLTPVVKALLTDLGFESTNLGLQVFGGHGYIREHGMEQYVRDCRIAQIYEGTNGVQALDLIGRKLPAQAGRNLRRFFHPVSEFINARIEDESQAALIQPLAKAFVRLQQATAHIARVGLAKPDEAAAAATEYLRLFGLVALGYLWARMAELSRGKLDDDPDGFHRAKLATARFYMDRLLPQTGALFSIIMAGGESILGFEEAAF
jgi:butyryl-CoA dehydrogenase